MYKKINATTTKMVTGGKFTLTPTNLAETIADIRYLQGGFIAAGCLLLLKAAYDITSSLKDIALTLKQTKLDLLEYNLSRKMELKAKEMAAESVLNFNKCAELGRNNAAQ